MNQTNIKEPEVKQIIETFDFVPNRNKLVITLNLIESKDKIVEEESALDEVQYVIASGETALYKPGDKVMLDIAKLMTPQRSSIDATNVMNILQVTPYQFNDNIFSIIDDNKVLGKFIK